MSRVLGPLPGNAFVVATRDSIPQPSVRVTTASSRGNLRGRGRGRTSAPRGPARSNGTLEQGTSSRGRKSKKTTEEDSTSDRRRKAGRGYNTGPGSADFLIFGDDQQGRATQIPDLNAEFFTDEFPLSHNAPPADEI